MKQFVSTMVGRYVRSRRGFTRVVTAFSVLGILLGVAALIVVLAVMSGFRQELMDRILGVTGHATLSSSGMTVTQAEAISAELAKVGGVIGASPLMQAQVMVTAGGRSTGVMVRGVGGEIPGYLWERLRLEGAPRGVAEGEVLVGSGLVRQLGILPGSGVNLLSPTGQRTIAGFIPSTLGATVGGMFTVGMVQYDNGLILANLADVQRLMRAGDQVQGVEVRVTDPHTIETLIPIFEETMMRVLGPETLPMDVRVETWQETNIEFFRALQVERVTMFIILSLIIIVAAFNIITGQMMLVSDKLADIAILRTMGATRSQVQRVFFWNGLLLGGMGTLGGIALGMLIVWKMDAVVNGIKSLTGVDLFPGDVYFLTELPGRVSWLDMGMVVGMAMLLTVLASFYPAWRAGKMSPVSLLRGA